MKEHPPIECNDFEYGGLCKHVYPDDPKEHVPQSVNNWHDEDHRSLGTCCTCKHKKVTKEARTLALQDAMEVVKLHKGANTENNMIGLEACFAVNQELEDILSALMSLAKK